MENRNSSEFGKTEILPKGTKLYTIVNSDDPDGVGMIFGTRSKALFAYVVMDGFHDLHFRKLPSDNNLKRGKLISSLWVKKDSNILLKQFTLQRDTKVHVEPKKLDFFYDLVTRDIEFLGILEHGVTLPISKSDIVTMEKPFGKIDIDQTITNFLFKRGEHTGKEATLTSFFMTKSISNIDPSIAINTATWEVNLELFILAFVYLLNIHDDPKQVRDLFIKESPEPGLKRIN